MTQTKTTKRALFASILSLLLCVSMLIGSTFAWFTDTASTGVNMIKAGNLDIVLEYWDGDSWETASESTKLFKENALWEPGYTEVAYLKVTNNGSLALNYQLAVNAVNEVEGVNVKGDTFKLSDYIQFGQVVSKTEIAKYTTREEAQAAATNVSTLKSFTKQEDLPVGESTYIALVVYMPTDVGNVANHNGKDVPSIDLGVVVNATQTPSETDSFNNQYDKDAVQEEVVVSNMPYGVKLTIEQNESHYVTKTTVEISTASALEWLAETDTKELIEKELKEKYSNVVPYSYEWEVKLTDNIDFAGKSIAPLDYWWADLDGNGKTISNVTIASTQENSGLFTEIKNGRTVSNLTLSNITVNTTYASGNPSIGALTGLASGATIDGVTVTNCTLGTTGAAKYTGGIVGQSGVATITNCTVTGGTIKGNRYTGGIVGDLFTEDSGEAKVAGCSVNGTTITGNSGETGSVVGRARSGGGTTTVTTSTCNVTNITGLEMIGVNYNSTATVN